jgi:Adenylate and Guanylate cyclase catalytic domain
VFGTEPDGFGAAFATAASAAEAAVQAQRELRADAAIGFAGRIGLHTAETTEQDGSYTGSEVNRAARLTALAHGGQILVPDATEVLLRNRMSLRPLGEHVLRGLRGQISAFQVIADDLHAEFPVLRSTERFAGNLPRRVTSLVGRDELVRQGAELVRGRPLVTLTGVGGVGKTRMALEIGAKLAGEFPDGTPVVELAAVGDPGSIPATIAAVLGITPQGEVPDGHDRRHAGRQAAAARHRQQRAAADHYAGQRPGTVRTARPAGARGHAAWRDVTGTSSAHHVPELGELGDRLTARLGATKAGELVAAGAGLDPDAAATYARGQLETATSGSASFPPTPSRNNAGPSTALT